MFILIDLTEIFWKNLQPMKNFPHSSVGKESTCNVGDLGSIPGLGRFPGEGKTYPLQYSGLENSMDYTVHGVTKSRTQLSDFYFSLSQSMRIFNMVWLD